MVKEVICIHIGQAGCQVGQKVWELLCHEHGIEKDGTIVGDTSPGVADEPYNSFFAETSAGQHVPRAIFLDTDPRSGDKVRSSEYRKLFHPDCVIGYKQDCKNNFFEGRTLAKLWKIESDLMDRVRIAVDSCTNLQGFFVFHSFGGGTGTGVGREILESLNAQFDKKVIFQPLIFPSRDFSSSIVEPYNCIFAMHNTKEFVDLSLMLDNQAAYRMCTTNLKIPNPDFEDLNRIIAQMVSACTTSLRFESEINASLDEMVTNLVPESTFRYPIISLSPVRPVNQGGHESFTTPEIVTDLFEERNLLADCGSHIKMNRYFAAVVLLRGTDKKAAAEMFGSETASQASGQGYAAKQPPIQVVDARWALHRLVNPPGGHRAPIRFVPWIEGGGFKVGVVANPPHIPGNPPFMAPSERQGCLLANSTAVRQLFVRQYTKFLKLFYRQAYVWQFLEANGELDMFMEAREGVRDLIDQYEAMMMQCVDYENQKADGRVTLEGRTGDFGDVQAAGGTGRNR
jgi:tubulin alpha